MTDTKQGQELPKLQGPMRLHTGLKNLSVEMLNCLHRSDVSRSVPIHVSDTSLKTTYASFFPQPIPQPLERTRSFFHFNLLPNSHDRAQNSLGFSSEDYSTSLRTQISARRLAKGTETALFKATGTGLVFAESHLRQDATLLAKHHKEPKKASQSQAPPVVRHPSGLQREGLDNFLLAQQKAAEKVQAKQRQLLLSRERLARVRSQQELANAQAAAHKQLVNRHYLEIKRSIDERSLKAREIKKATRRFLAPNDRPGFNYFSSDSKSVPSRPELPPLLFSSGANVDILHKHTANIPSIGAA